MPSQKGGGVNVYCVKPVPDTLYNCFGAVGEWCALMGDSFLKSIHDTKTYKEYFAWPMYKQYHTAWIFDVLNT